MEGSFLIRFILIISLISTLFSESRWHYQADGEFEQTQIDGELLNDQAYRRQIKENFDRDGYISSVSERLYFGKEQKRVVILDPKKAEDIGLDIEGFFG